MHKLLFVQYESCKHHIKIFVDTMVNNYGFTLVNISSGFKYNTSITQLLNDLSITLYDVKCFFVIDSYNDILVHHIFNDFYDYSNINRYIYTDSFHIEQDTKSINYYNNFIKIFTPHLKQFLQKYDVNSSLVYWVPHASSSSSFKHEKVEKKLLVCGKNLSTHPFRRKMIKESINELIEYKECVTQNELKNYTACFADCSSMHFIGPLYFEILMSGSLLVGEDNCYEDLIKLGMIEGIHYIRCTESDIMQKLDWIFDPINEPKINIIKKNAVNLATKLHTIERRIDHIMRIINNYSIKELFLLSDYNSLNKYHIFGIEKSGTHAITTWVHRMQSNSILIDDATKEFCTPDSLIPKISEETNKVKCYEKVVTNFSSKQPLLFLHKNSPMVEVNTIITDCKVLISKLIIIIRNPYNNLASILKNYLKEDEIASIIKKFIDLWKQYFYVCMQYPECVVVYDEWVNSRGYRVAVANNLCLSNKEKNIFQITERGKSSFDTNSKNIEINSVLRRYENYRSNELYNELVMNDKELKVMWNSITTVFCSSLKNYKYSIMTNTPALII
uniref:Uncharacterized protein n=1 Tax=viral metagenome TaxID=1070528 RepID=A0A6C0J546_9ZZZZ